jgi:hypothetical protein
MDHKFNKTEYFLLEGARSAPSNKKYSRLINCKILYERCVVVSTLPSANLIVFP